jgi:peptidoglycan/xylan/chitin deacetylase (PgdA/CDA1 family)
MRRHIRAILAAAAILAIPMAAQANDLPTLPQAADQPRPAGTRAKLRVLDWAGMRAAVSYTFDDAQPSQSEHLDELLATGAPMTEYIVSSAMQTAPDFVSSWRKAGKAGWELGNHTGHHCPFGQACGGLARFDAASDIDAAERVITGTLKAPGVWTLAYPFGDTRWREATEPRVFLARGCSRAASRPMAAIATTCRCSRWRRARWPAISTRGWIRRGRSATG